LGSSMFVSTIISSTIALISKDPINVTPQYFMRDILFYIVSISMILYAMAIRGHIDTFASGIYLCLYVV
jgi:Ca2+/Na+ antiporter